MKVNYYYFFYRSDVNLIPTGLRGKADSKFEHVVIFRLVGYCEHYIAPEDTAGNICSVSVKSVKS